MSTHDPRVDAYIAAAAPFAQPLLTTLRQRMHAASNALDEDIKWRMPFFTHAGRPLAHMAAFKQHCILGFWRGKEMLGSDKDDQAMGQFGRITTAAELPSAKELKALVQAAIARIETADTAPAAPRVAKPLPAMPADLAAALAAVPAARAHFDSLAPSHRREYLDWVLQAKREATRAQRILKAVDRLGQGLKLN